MSEDGYITLTFEKKIVPYIISIDDLSELTKASDEATEEISVAEASAETSEEVTESAPDAIEKTKTENSNYGSIIAVVTVIVLLGTAVLLAVKKKKK